MVQANAINYYSPARWVVSKTSGEGTHTTIAGALSDATSGETIFVMPGTYTENLTLVAGVNITTFGGEELGNAPNVIIVGKCTFTTAGSAVFFGIRLQTNSDFLLAVTGSADSQVFLTNCYLDCTNNTGISHTSSGAGTNIVLQDCGGDIGTVGTTFFVSTAAGNIRGTKVSISNSGSTVTPSTASVGGISFVSSSFFIPFTITGTAKIAFQKSSISNSPTNITCITASGTDGGFFDPKVILQTTRLDSKSSASGAIAIGTGLHARLVGGCTILSDVANAITGDGILDYSPIALFTTTSTSVTTETPLAIGPEVLVASNLLTTGNLVSDIGTVSNQWKTVHAGNVTFNGGSDFLDDYEEGTFTPTLIGTTGSIGAQTYTFQTGIYIKIGSKVMTWGLITLSNKGSWTGVALLDNLPFTGNASFYGGAQLIDGRDLTVTGGNPYIATNDLTVMNRTNVELTSAGSGASATDQLYSGIANNTSMYYNFTYLE